MKDGSEPSGRERAPDEPVRARGELIEEAIALLLIAAVVGAYAWDVREIPQPDVNLLFMRPVLIGSGILILIVLWRFIVRPLHAARARSPTAAAPPEAGRPGRSRVLQMVTVTGMLIAYSAVFTVIPFVVSTTLFMALSLLGLGNRNLIFVSGVSVGTALTLYFVGYAVLGVDLP